MEADETRFTDGGQASGDWSSWAEPGADGAAGGSPAVTNGDGRLGGVWGGARRLRMSGRQRRIASSGRARAGGAICRRVIGGVYGGAELTGWYILCQTSAPDGWSRGKTEVAVWTAAHVDRRGGAVRHREARYQLVHRWQTRPESHADWSGWMGLGGAIEPGFGVGLNGRERRLPEPTTVWSGFAQSAPGANRDRVAGFQCDDAEVAGS